MTPRNEHSTLRLLQTGNSALIEFIRARMGACGPVPFAWFMEQALYHPEHGYYSAGRAVIGRGGDYFTSVSVGPLFGQLMAGQFAEMWTSLGKPSEFVIVEQGAHDGQFAHDVLAAAELAHPRFFAALRYCIVEPFRELGWRQMETLARFAEQVRWSESIDTLEPFCGVHFSNELLDAMPVHLVKWDGAEWRERHVTDSADGFVFIDLPIANDALRAQLDRIPVPAVSGYETEVNLAATAWIEGVARKLMKGFVVAVDYGFARDEFHAPHRTSGTLQCRARHRIITSPLIEVGEADITAHVNWTDVAEHAERRGLSLLGFTDQHHFIIGLLAHGDPEAFDDSVDEKSRRALQTLLHPGFLGMTFQFLVLGKDVDQVPPLAGLQFARNSRATLGLSSRGCEARRRTSQTQ